MYKRQVLVLERLSIKELEELAQRAEAQAKASLPLETAARMDLLEMADGDGRRLLNLIEQIKGWRLKVPLNQAALAKRLMKRVAIYDKSGIATII